MKTFAEMLPTSTAEMREFVEAYKRDQEEWHCMGCDGESPYDLMLSTPPAKEPVSVEGKVYDGVNFTVLADAFSWPEGFDVGDRVRVVKIEETK